MTFRNMLRVVWVVGMLVLTRAVVHAEWTNPHWISTHFYETSNIGLCDAQFQSNCYDLCTIAYGMTYDGVICPGGTNQQGNNSCECYDSVGCSDFGESCGSNFDCCTNYCSPGNSTCSGGGSPILVNLSDNGSTDPLTSVQDGVRFDILADGIRRQVAWTRADANVGFLFLDRNHNGLVDDASELFGNHTVRRDGTIAWNGFDALVDLDGGATASDGKLTAADAVFSDLRLWIDRNHNGISEVDEITTLSSAGITTIFTSYTDNQRIDRFNNEYRFEGTALISKANRELPRKIFDVYFSVAGM